MLRNKNAMCAPMLTHNARETMQWYWLVVSFYVNNKKKHIFAMFKDFHFASCLAAIFFSLSLRQFSCNFKLCDNHFYKFTSHKARNIFQFILIKIHEMTFLTPVTLKNIKVITSRTIYFFSTSHSLLLLLVLKKKKTFNRNTRAMILHC